MPIASALAVTVSMTHLTTFGTFLPAIQADTGWSRSAISLGTLLVSIVSVLLAPLVGLAIDRFGSRRIGVPGLAIYLGGIALLGATATSLAAWLFAWLVVAIGAVLCKFTVWAAAISRQYDSDRGVALAIALTGTGISAMMMPLLSMIALDSVGWRNAYIGIAGIEGLICLPVVLKWFHSNPANPPDPRQEGVREASHAVRGLGIREALASLRFAKMAVAAIAVYAPLIGLSVHFIPILRDTGQPAMSAALIATSIGAFAIVGQLTCGWLLDRVEGRRIALIYFSLPIWAAALLLWGQVLAAALGAAIIIGFVSGSCLAIVAYLASRYFGLRHYGAVFGTLVGVVSFSAGLGSLAGGAIYDHSGSYAAFLALCMPCFALSAVLMYTLGDYPDFDQIDDPAAYARN